MLTLDPNLKWSNRLYKILCLKSSSLWIDVSFNFVSKHSPGKCHLGWRKLCVRWYSKVGPTVWWVHFYFLLCPVSSVCVPWKNALQPAIYCFASERVLEGNRWTDPMVANLWGQKTTKPTKMAFAGSRFWYRTLKVIASWKKSYKKSAFRPINNSQNGFPVKFVHFFAIPSSRLSMDVSGITRQGWGNPVETFDSHLFFNFCLYFWLFSQFLLPSSSLLLAGAGNKLKKGSTIFCQIQVSLFWQLIFRLKTPNIVLEPHLLNNEKFSCVSNAIL